MCSGQIQALLLLQLLLLPPVSLALFAGTRRFAPRARLDHHREEVCSDRQLLESLLKEPDSGEGELKCECGAALDRHLHTLLCGKKGSPKRAHNTVRTRDYQQLLSLTLWCN